MSHARESVEVNRRVIELAPENNSYWSEYSNHLDVARRQMEMAPGNINYRRRYAYSLSGVAGLAAMLGPVDLAANNYTMSGDILQELSILEPANVDFRFEYLMREARHSTLIARTGESQGPLKRMKQIYEPLKDDLVSEGFENLRHNSHWIIYLLNYSELADELLGKGYLDPGFIAFCREFEICSEET